jgi:hypothetical protein
MIQLTFSVPDPIALAIEAEAKKSGKTVPLFLRDLVIAHIHPAWTEHYKNKVLGNWRGDAPQRPAQTLPEERNAW